MTDPEAALAARRDDYLKWLHSMPTASADAYVLAVLVARLVGADGLGDASCHDVEGLAALQYLRARLEVPAH